MRQIILFVLFTIATSFTFTPAAFAKTMDVEAQITMSGDNVSEIDEADALKVGWKKTTVDEEDVYTFTKSIDKTKLPFHSAIGDAYLSISKTGLIEIGISIGDADAGAEASLQWPTAQKKFVVLDQPLTLKVNGGENASGAWSFIAKATVNYID